MYKCSIVLTNRNPGRYFHSISLFFRTVCAAVLILILCVWSEAIAAGRQGAHDGPVELISGFVNAAFTDNLTKSESGFSLKEAELDFVKVFSGRAALRLDLNFKDGGADDLNPSGSGNAVSIDDLVEQGYVSLTDGNHTLLLGKFNAPIGVESPDPAENYQISRSMIFESGLPVNLTGVFMLSDFGTMDFSFYMVNGWDNIIKDSKSRTYGGRVGFTPADFFDFGLSYISGNAAGRGRWNSPEKLWVFDFDMKIRSDGSVMGFEYTRGIHEKNSLLSPGVDDARWHGLLFMTYFELAPGSGISFMYDVFADDDGSRFTSGIKETREAFTLSPTFALPGGPILRLEYRMVTSNMNVFKRENNQGSNRERLFGAEVLYGF